MSEAESHAMVASGEIYLSDFKFVLNKCWAKHGMIRDMSTSQISSAANALVSIIPQVLWIGLALYAFNKLYNPILGYISEGRIEQINVFQIQIKIAQKNLSEVKNVEGTLRTPEEFAPFKERIERLSRKIVGANILWVDDQHPMKNLRERRAFAALGMSIDMVSNTDDAMRMFDVTNYDVVISDMSRPGQPDNDTPCGNSVSGAGCGLLKIMNKQLTIKQPPTIIYAGKYNPSLGTPPFAFAITNRLDDLLQYVLDAIERRPATTALPASK